MEIRKQGDTLVVCRNGAYFDMGAQAWLPCFRGERQNCETTCSNLVVEQSGGSCRLFCRQFVGPALVEIAEFARVRRDQWPMPEEFDAK